jgi:hypothetical protein
MYMKYIISLILICISPCIVSAYQDFFHTITFCIGEIPQSDITKPLGVEYDPNDVIGTYTADMSTVRIDDLVDTDYKRRIAYMYDRVSLPPYSKIDVLYYWNNIAQSEKYVPVARILLSRSLFNKGDLTNLVHSNMRQIEVGGWFTGDTCSYIDGVNKCRYGKYLESYQLWYLFWKSQEGIPAAGLTMNPPFVLEKKEMEILDESRVILKIKVKNTGPYYLSSVKYSHEDFEYTRDFAKNESYTYEYEIGYEKYKNSYKFGFALIDSPTIVSECVVTGGNWDEWTQVESISSYSLIDNQWIHGAQVQPGYESFCITRIPFKMSTEEIIITPDIDIFNLNTLPITSKSIYVLIKEWLIDKLKVL